MSPVQNDYPPSPSTLTLKDSSSRGRSPEALVKPINNQDPGYLIGSLCRSRGAPGEPAPANKRWAACPEGKRKAFHDRSGTCPRRVLMPPRLFGLSLGRGEF